MLAELASVGYVVLDADGLSHEATLEPDVKAAIVTLLGESAYTPQGAYDRKAVRARVFSDPAARAGLESIVHPAVARRRTLFAAEHAGADIVLFDIPLLFETGADRGLDAILVVSVPAGEQRRRVMVRPGMTEAQFQAILARQMPDAEKRRRATHIIWTTALEPARAAVQGLIRSIREARDA